MKLNKERKLKMKKLCITLMSLFMIFAFNSMSFANSVVPVPPQQQQQQKMKMQQKQIAVGIGVGVGIAGSKSVSQGGTGGTGIGGTGGTGGTGGNVGIKDSMNPKANAGFELKDSFNQIPLRDFPVPGQVTFPMTPGYFGPSTPGQNFIPLRTIMMYNASWNKSTIDNMVGDNSGWGDGLNLQIRRLVKVEPENNDEENEEEIKVYTSTTKPKNGNVTQIAFATVATDDDEHISIDDFARLLQECYKMGGNVVQFTSEGVNRKMRASGWGIGINNSTAVMSSGQGLGNMATGGTGYSNGTSGYVDRPWLQAVFLKVESDNIQFEPKPVPKKQSELSDIEKRLSTLETRENSGTLVKDTVR